MKKRLFSIIIAVFSLSVILPGALSQSELPKPSGFVNDFANIINPEAKSQLEELLTSFNEATSIEISVVTTPFLNDIPVEDYATQLFEQWGIGKKGGDNGLLVLVAPNDRKARIEVGYGLEGAINDALAGRIMDETMIPRFKEDDFSGGILSSVVASIQTLNEKLNLNFDPSKVAGINHNLLNPMEVHKSTVLSKIFKLIIGLIIFFIFIRNPIAGLFLMSGMSSGRGGFRSGGFGGGGFGGFGGGMSGGGGASRGW